METLGRISRGDPGISQSDQQRQTNQTDSIRLVRDHNASAEEAFLASSPRDSLMPAAAAAGDRCPVCLEECRDGVAVGVCRHPVCVECGVRHRAVCGRSECPVCRRDLDRVFVLALPSDLSTAEASLVLGVDRRLGLVFGSHALQDRVRSLLSLQCPVCHKADFARFQQLDQHVRRQHQLFFCAVCVDSLKVFPRARRVYSRSALARHHRRGDADCPELGGHPKCLFCNDRFADRDAVFAHLRREHFQCHLCQHDDRQVFFDVYDDLAQHFRGSHFYCQQDECRGQKFVNAFRSAIDYKAHLAREHSRSTSKKDLVLNGLLELRSSRVSVPASPSSVVSQFNRRRGREQGVQDEAQQAPSAAAVTAEPPDLGETTFPTLGDRPTPPASTLRTAHRPPPPEAFPALSPPTPSSLAASCAFLSTPQTGRKTANTSAWGKRGAGNDFPSLHVPAARIKGFGKEHFSAKNAPDCLASSWASKAESTKVETVVRPEKGVGERPAKMVVLTKRRLH